MECQCNVSCDNSITTSGTVDAPCPNVSLVYSGLQFSEHLNPSTSSIEQISSTSYNPVVSDLSNSVQVVSNRCFITNFCSNDEIIVPDQWPHIDNQDERKNSTINFIPKIRVKTLEQLQESQMRCKIKPYEPKKNRLCNKKVDQIKCINRHTMMKAKKGIGKSKDYNSSITTETSQSGNCKSKKQNTSSKTENHDVKFQKREDILENRLLNIKEKQKLLCSISGGKTEHKSSQVHPKKLGSRFDLKENNDNRNPASSQNQLQNERSVWFNPDVNVLDSITREETKENKQECNKNPIVIEADVLEEIDLTGLKEGIIKASRTLISTEKALKILSQIVCGHITLTNQGTINQVHKFQKIMESFCKQIDEIDKTVINQYKHLVKDKNSQLFLEPIYTPVEEKCRDVRLENVDVLLEEEIRMKSLLALKEAVNIEHKSDIDKEQKNKSNFIRIPKITVIQSKWMSNKNRKLSRIHRSKSVVEDVMYRPISQKKHSTSIMPSISEA